MKKILITQRCDVIEGREEIREALDIKWANILFDLGFLPIPACSGLIGTSNYIGKLMPDGILLSGGNDLGSFPQRDLFEGEILDYARNNNLPLLGVCRGMQMLNSYLGGGLSEVKDHVATNHIIKGEWAKKQGYHMVNSYHNQAIKIHNLAQSLDVLATSSDGVIEAVKHTSLPWMGIMWHPEREPELSNADRHLIRMLFGQNNT